MRFGAVINRPNALQIIIKCIEYASQCGDTELVLELTDILIGNSSNEGDTVFDPFMGIGGCGVSCEKLGRKFIGIELNEKYFKIAKNRIQDIVV